VAGEWHNNHHLYPSSARSGFLAHQVDLAWYYIKGMSLLGAISSYHDSKELFLKQYHLPYKQQTSPPAKNAAASVREKYAEQNATSKG
jgi:stearoyl-CoA desaturase (delta-9 desaturase)